MGSGGRERLMQAIVIHRRRRTNRRGYRYLGNCCLGCNEQGAALSTAALHWRIRFFLGESFEKHSVDTSARC